jgi:hypothetical protein
MPKTTGKSRSRGEWIQLMADYEASNQTQRDFCARRDIPYSSFCYWRKRLRTPVADESNVPALIELPALAPDSAPAWRIELDLGAGVVLRIR